MITATGPGALSAASRIGFLGDTYGDMQHVLTVARTMSARGIELLVVLGDFGFLWPGHNWGIDIDKLSRRLKATHQTLAFVDGNHEDFDLLYKFPVADDGMRWIRPNVVHIPRGSGPYLQAAPPLLPSAITGVLLQRHLESP